MTESSHAPLAARARPTSVEDVVGQEHLLAPGKPLYEAAKGNPHSMILWGPPGTGKTTLAHIVAGAADADLVAISAVLSGVADIRKAIAAAESNAGLNRRTIVFVDEVHRFNKAQQDAFLPHVESGAFIFIGATTENPSFEVNNALLSRARVYVLRSPSAEAIAAVLKRAAETHELGPPVPEDSVLQLLALSADGDVRRALGLLEMAADLAGREPVTPQIVEEVSAGALRRFDKGGDAFYDQISALHKSVRSSNPDAALYWFCRMLDGGCDPRYVARRLLRMASEDIGNADPRALALTLDAWQTYERLGSPEGELALAQSVCYMASCAKSNAVYEAYKGAMADVQHSGSLEVPKHLRNAPTRLMKSLGHGAGYQYDHDSPEGVAYDQACFPEELGERTYYHPVDAGLEKRIAEKLAYIREQRQAKR